MKHFLLSIAAFLFGFSLFVDPVLAQGDYGLGATAREAGLTAAGGDVSILAGRVVGTALSLIGVLFFILMIYGGFTWMTARGNEQQTEKAKTTITAAVIGMIIVLASYAITNFVFEAVKGDVQNGFFQTALNLDNCDVDAPECGSFSQSACEAAPSCCTWVNV